MLGIFALNPVSFTMSQLLYSFDDRPYGKSWSEWTISWWKWRLPLSSSNDLQFHRYDHNVIFLPYSFVEYNENDLIMPAGKDLFFPTITAINSDREDKGMKTDQDLIQWSKEDIGKVTKREVTLNGQRLESIPVCSEPFNAEYPTCNRWNVTPGPSRAICSGYWTFIRGLSAGKYEIHTLGSCLAGKIKREGYYSLTLTSN
jgi:hypothetical protein